MACTLALGTVPVSGYAADSATLGQGLSPTPSTSSEGAGSAAPAASSAAQPALSETISAKDGSAVEGSESEKSTARTDAAAPAASAEGENPSAATSAKEAAPASASGGRPSVHSLRNRQKRVSRRHSPGREDVSITTPSRSTRKPLRRTRYLTPLFLRLTRAPRKWRSTARSRLSRRIPS